MSFHSYAFVLAFLPIAVLGFHCKKKIGNTGSTKFFLVLLSLIFLGFSDVRNVVILLLSMLVNYLVFMAMQKSGKKKILLVIGILLNLLALFYFKYTDSLFVPLGISFFTFSQIAFLMENYRGELSNMSLSNYSVYVTFFPKMVQGPIMLPGEMEKQLDEAIEKKADWEACFKGFALFVLGLSKKVLLADTFGVAVNHGYTNLSSLASGDAWILMLSYTLQIYFDFSGYCDMAMGVSQMMGFSLPLNFDSPYKANNILEFWKRWHMTLTRFFTKYLYIPLGGNRKGEVRTYLNMLIIFFVSGIWHGAGLTFILWGILHGTLYVITKWLKSRREDAKQAQQSDAKFFCTARHVLSVACTFLYVNIAWIFFRASTLQEALSVLKKMFSFEFRKINLNFAKCFELDEFWYVMKVLKMDRFDWAHYVLMVLLLLVALAIVFFGKTAPQISEKMKPSFLHVCVLSVLLVWCILSFSNVSSFIYVNF